MRRKRRQGEVVCRCRAYKFPHRQMGGECDGSAWVLSFFEQNLWGACRDCRGWGGDDRVLTKVGGAWYNLSTVGIPPTPIEDREMTEHHYYAAPGED